MTEILFEKLEFGYFNVEPQAKASLLLVEKQPE